MEAAESDSQLAPGLVRDSRKKTIRGPNTHRSELIGPVYSTMWFNSTPMTTVQLDRTFAALADPTRRAILGRLASGDATVSELAEPLPISIQAVSKHLKVLEGAGLITRGRTAQLRPSHLEGTPLKQVADWVEGYRGFWESGFGRMDERLRSGGKASHD
jgi:DNA-binding transcriptional ArsR family regulator